MKIEIECYELEYEYLRRALQLAREVSAEKAKLNPDWGGMRFSTREWELAFDQSITFPADYTGPRVKIVEGK